MFEAFEEPVAEDVPPEREEPQSADDEDDDEPETLTTADLLGLHEVNPAAAALDLAIVPPGGSNNTSAIRLGKTIAGSSGWELSSGHSTAQQQPAGREQAGWGIRQAVAGLDSLYEDGARRRQQVTMDATYGNGHSYDQQNEDPFAMSNGVAQPTGVHMSMMARQQQQAMFWMPQQLQFEPQYGAAAASQFNPFGDAYSVALSSQGAPLHGIGGSLI